MRTTCNLMYIYIVFEIQKAIEKCTCLCASKALFNNFFIINVF